jgi:hypothetical protein
VVVDFNEEIVPKVGEKDLFLSSTVRRHAGMPTRTDKENLQKHYYYRLLQNSARAAVCWVANETAQPSRFLRELGLEERAPEGARYRPLIAPVSTMPGLYEGVPQEPNPFANDASLTPSRLKDWLVCPRRFHYRYRLKIARDGQEEKADGTLIHEALEAAARAKADFAGPGDYLDFVLDHLYRHAQSRVRRFNLALEWEARLERFCHEDFESLVNSEQVVLEDWREVTWEGFRLGARIDRVDLTDVNPIDQDRPTVWLIEFQDQLRNRTFTRTNTPYYGHFFTRVNGETNLL